MCGIAGIWTRGQVRAADALAMADTLAHRGPDGDGVWADPHAGIALSHRRLSIIDPSPAGRQPMPSPCGRFILSFNGEIYNHRALRAELEAAGAVAWNGHSDTETLVHAIARWGLGATLRRCVGMFALALWDVEARTLALARDRIGEKPLYYGWAGDGVVFGSELKALRAAPGFAAEVDPRALALLLRHNCVPAPFAILRNVFKVEPGVIVTLTAEALRSPPPSPPRAGAAAGSGVGCERYWSLDALVAAGADPDMTAGEAVDGLEARLRDAIAGQLVADRPLGAFLSGGVDSSAVVAIASEVAAGPLRTFTIGFDHAGFDEAPHARAVARHLGTDHHELYVDAEDVQAAIPALPQIYDEPFADSSQLPTVLLTRLAGGSVRVALSGDGGDELFCGYNRYLVPRRAWDALGALPAPLRRGLGSTIAAVPPAGWDRIGRGPGIPMLGVKAHKVARMLRQGADTDALYRASAEEWGDGLPLATPPCLPPREAPALRATPEERMMHWDMRGYLPDDILTKVDRASMAASLETRVPLLDHRVVEQAWRTPLAFKKRDGHGKWALRQLLYRRVPQALIERPKAGFAVPVGAWLRGPLRDWAEALLDESDLRADPFLDSVPIRRRWAEHLAGRHDWTGSLWGVLTYRAWAAQW